MTETSDGCLRFHEDPPHDRRAHHCAHVVVHPLDPAEAEPGRRVEVLGRPVGSARSFAELGEICRRAGLPDLDLALPGSIEWLGGDARTWRTQDAVAGRR
jgi:hypothetical protein